MNVPPLTRSTNVYCGLSQILNLYLLSIEEGVHWVHDPPSPSTTSFTIYCTSQRFAAGSVIGLKSDRGFRGSSNNWPDCRVGLSIISGESCFESLWRGFWCLGIHCLSAGMGGRFEKELKSFLRGLVWARTMRYSWKANDAVACGSVMMYHSSGSRILGFSQVDFDHARESLDRVSSHADIRIDWRCHCQVSCCDHVLYPYPYAISLTKIVKHAWWVVLLVKNSCKSNS